MKYREFLKKVMIAQLREGRDGLRVVGDGLIVPHPEWSSAEEWEVTIQKTSCRMSTNKLTSSRCNGATHTMEVNHGDSNHSGPR